MYLYQLPELSCSELPEQKIMTMVDGVAKSKSVAQSRKVHKDNYLFLCVKQIASWRLCAKRVVFTRASRVIN
jgi:hypothetical protein